MCVQVLECRAQLNSLHAEIATLQADATARAEVEARGDRVRRLGEENERLRLLSEISLLRSHISDTALSDDFDDERSRLEAELADMREVAE